MSRTDAIINMRAQGMSYKQIADELGLSRQRIQKLVLPNKVTIKVLKERANGLCEDCGVSLTSGHIHHIRSTVSSEEYNKLPNLKYLCISCHRKKENGTLDTNIYKCLVCNIEHSLSGRDIKSKLFCSKLCWCKYFNIPAESITHYPMSHEEREERNRWICYLYTNHPGISFEVMSEGFKLVPTYIKQILVETGIYCPNKKSSNSILQY